MKFLERLQQQDDDFKKMLVASLALHFAVILFFTIRGVFFPGEIPRYQPSIRVDLVGLPEKRKPEAPIAAPAEKPKEAKVESKKEEKHKEITKKVAEKKIDDKKISKAQNSALDKLKTLSAIDKLKNMKDTKDASSTKKNSEVIKGNQATAGNALQGLQKIEFNEYIGNLDAQVKSHWALPEWMSSLNLQARIMIKIDKN